MGKANILLAVVVSLCIGGYAIFQTIADQSAAVNTSNASGTKGTIHIAYDSWLGYVPITSSHMKRGLRSRGYNLVTTNDNADYGDRFKKLSKGDYEMVVASLDGGLIESEDWNFPGVIPFIIDVSNGGDKLVSWCDDILDVDALKTKGKIAFTPESPSHHLIKSLAVHFGVKRFRSSGGWAIHTEGAEEAYDKLMAHEVEAAVLWEPYSSQALTDNKMCEVIGTQNTTNLIVDVLLVNREFLIDNPEIVRAFTKQYFTTLKYYLSADHQAEFYDEIRVNNKRMTDDQIKNAIAGVEFVNLTDNCEQWIGCNDEGETLVDAIDATLAILIKYGDFSSNPLPDENAYTMINRDVAEQVFKHGISGEIAGDEMVDPLTAPFSVLTDKQWGEMKTVGTLQVDPIRFTASSRKLGLDSKNIVDNAVENLKGYPNFRIMIQGHTSKRGNAEGNKTLSTKRAKAVARYMEVTYGIDPNRMLVTGFGGDNTLRKKAGESMRAYTYRLSRVELILVSDRF